MDSSYEPDLVASVRDTPINSIVRKYASAADDSMQQLTHSLRNAEASFGQDSDQAAHVREALRDALWRLEDSISTKQDHAMSGIEKAQSASSQEKDVHVVEQMFERVDIR